MPDILDVITSRRSIRRYTDQAVPDEMIDKILEAARWAPTGENYQPWRFVVVRDPEMREKLARLAQKHVAAEGATMNSADLERRILGITDPAKRAKVLARLTEFFGTGDALVMQLKAPVVIVTLAYVQTLDPAWDVSACLENMSLEAHALGLGTCWVNACPGLREEREWQQTLGIPSGISDYKIMAYLSVGWPAESPKARPKKPLEDLVYWEKFGNTVRP